MGFVNSVAKWPRTCWGWGVAGSGNRLYASPAPSQRRHSVNTQEMSVCGQTCLCFVECVAMCVVDIMGLCVMNWPWTVEFLSVRWDGGLAGFSPDYYWIWGWADSEIMQATTAPCEYLPLCWSDSLIPLRCPRGALSLSQLLDPILLWKSCFLSADPWGSVFD